MRRHHTDTHSAGRWSDWLYRWLHIDVDRFVNDFDQYGDHDYYQHDPAADDGYVWRTDLADHNWRPGAEVQRLDSEFRDYFRGWSGMA